MGHVHVTDSVSEPHHDFFEGIMKHESRDSWMRRLAHERYYNKDPSIVNMMSTW